MTKSTKTSNDKTLPEKLNDRIILTNIKLCSSFDIKDDTNRQHKYDLVYFNKCFSTFCSDSYIGKTARCLGECVVNHVHRGIKSRIVRHSSNADHETVNVENR